MLCELETWQLITENEKEDIQILSEACSRNDEIADTIKKTYEPIRKKMPPPQFIQLTRSYLLDTKKTRFSVLEKYAYDIAMFQLNARGIPLDDDIYIQIGFKSGKTDMIRELHVDWFPNDEVESRIALSSILYLNHSPRPTIFTDITMKEHDAKDFENQENLCFSFPTPLKLISFNGRKYFHGYYDVNDVSAADTDRPMIILKVWDSKTRPWIDYFDNTVFSLENTISKESPSRIRFLPLMNQKQIHLPNDEIIYPRFFENLLFYPKLELCYPFAPWIQKNTDILIFHKGPGHSKLWDTYWWVIFIGFVVFTLVAWSNFHYFSMQNILPQMQ